MTSFTGTPLLTQKRGAEAPSRARIVARLTLGVNGLHGYYFPLCAGESSRVLVDPRRGDSDPRRARAVGRCQRAGISPPGTPVRGRARLLGDGLLRGNRASE